MKAVIVLPACNEAGRLEQCVRDVQWHLKGIDYEIIIAEDGSTDGTDKIAFELAKQERITHLHNPEKLGRGRALREAFSTGLDAEVYAYLDVDGATDMMHLQNLLKYAEKYDVVAGSRYLRGSMIYKRPLSRIIASRTHAWLLRLMTGCDIRDAQCGFKAFRRGFIKEELWRVREDSWAWDEILMVEAIKRGYSVKEFAIVWREKRGAAHSGSVKRLLSDTKLHGWVLIKLFLRWRLGIMVRV